MKKSRRSSIIRVLRSELVPSFGCTEPVAVGLATSIAYNAIQENLPSWLETQWTAKTRLEEVTQRDIERIVVDLDRFTYRNGLDVEIPGTGGKRGILTAAALGVFCDPNKKLSIFEDSSAEKAESMSELLKTNKVRLRVADTREVPSMYIRAEVQVKRANGSFSQGIAVIQYTHTNVAFIKKDHRFLYRRKCSDRNGLDDGMKALSKIQLKEIVDVAMNLPREDYDLVSRSIYMNLGAAEVGLRNKSGLKVGYTLQRLRDEETLGDDMIAHAVAITGAAVDARMSGEVVPVMSCGGSGNQGLVATLPIVAIAKEQGWDEKKVARAVALSYLITCYCTSHLGYLSTLCGGAVKAGVGATAGIVYYLGGKLHQINSAMKNLIECIAGILCDGAGRSCAMKLATISGAAVKSALLALNGVEVPSRKGIAGKNLEETMKNVKRISDGMNKVDEAVLEIISASTKQAIVASHS